jgi:hypothetical protein
MLGPAALAAMKPSAWLINVARGDRGRGGSARRSGLPDRRPSWTPDTEPLPPSTAGRSTCDHPHIRGPDPARDRPDLRRQPRRYLAGRPSETRSPPPRLLMATIEALWAAWDQPGLEHPACGSTPAARGPIADHRARRRRRPFRARSRSRPTRTGGCRADRASATRCGPSTRTGSATDRRGHRRRPAARRLPDIDVYPPTPCRSGGCPRSRRALRSPSRSPGWRCRS